MKVNVIVNGEKTFTYAENLYELKTMMQIKAENMVTIVDGYQTDDNIELQDNQNIIFIEKGKLPPKECMEQMLLARHTPGVHQKLKNARIAIAGLGGLGSNIAVMLARTGVGHLHLVDFDIVEPSNLNRQQYRIAHLGMPKAEALKEEIAEINPFVEVKAENIKITAQNAAKLFHDADIVCEAFDVPEAKAMLVNTMLVEFPEKPIVAASGMAGYESSNSIKTKKVMENFYLCGDEENAAEIGKGLMAPRVSICAGHQANMILRLIIGEDGA